jgi:RNA polymerase sigma-70 factor (ECF subfamily)
MTESNEPPDWEHHRGSLLLWAKCRMPDWLRAKLDPADLVQQTLLEAHAAREKLAALPDAERLAYLRRALTNNLIDAERKHGRARNDLSPDAFAQSSVRMLDWIEAQHTSPSERADRNERFERLAAALAELPESQRVVVEMRYLQKLKIAEIAELIGRSEGAVSQLLHRAVTALRDVLTDLNP